MRRGRGKGKKQNASAREDRGSGDEEKIPAYRRRGRPQKPMKDDFEEEEEEDDEEMVEKMEVEDEDEEIDDGSVTSKDLKERKRKMSNGSNTDLTEEENGLGSKPNTDDSTRSTSIGFSQNGSRRKSKPRRAAEAVVECNGV